MRTSTGAFSSSSMYFFGAGAAFEEALDVVCRFGRDGALSTARSVFAVLLAMVLRYARAPTERRNDAAFWAISL